MIENGQVTGQAETYFYVAQRTSGPVSVDISVDRENGTYLIGETVRMRYTVSRPVYIKIYDCPPGQSCRVISQGNDDGRGGVLTGTATAPTG